MESVPVRGRDHRMTDSTAGRVNRRTPPNPDHKPEPGSITQATHRPRTTTEDKAPPARKSDGAAAAPTLSRRWLAPLRAPGSWLLHRVDRAASRPVIAIAVVALAAAWVAVSAVLDFPTKAETVFQTLVAALTLAMVFVIQHTQSRLNVATQRKLDELLRAAPAADNTVISLEHASDDELQTATETHQQAREDALHGP